MKISRALEDYFLQISFILQTNPTPKYGIDRQAEIGVLNKYVITNLPPREVWPEIQRLQKREFYLNDELTLMLRTTDLYLDWLYASHT